MIDSFVVEFNFYYLTWEFWKWWLIVGLGLSPITLCRNQVLANRDFKRMVSNSQIRRNKQARWLVLLLAIAIPPISLVILYKQKQTNPNKTKAHNQVGFIIYLPKQ